VFSEIDTESEIEAVVSNRSFGPIYDCQLSLLPWAWDTKSEAVEGRLFVALAAQTDSAAVPFTASLIGRPPKRGAFAPPLKLEFTDGRGRGWCRWPDGRLEKLRTRPSRKPQRS
jgi:hypothetical protein